MCFASLSLQAALFVPAAETFGKGPFPLVVSTYGGPHLQTVANTWTLSADLRAQFLRSQGQSPARPNMTCSTCVLGLVHALPASVAQRVR